MYWNKCLNLDTHEYFITVTRFPVYQKLYWKLIQFLSFGQCTWTWKKCTEPLGVSISLPLVTVVSTGDPNYLVWYFVNFNQYIVYYGVKHLIFPTSILLSYLSFALSTYELIGLLSDNKVLLNLLMRLCNTYFRARLHKRWRPLIVSWGS